MSAESASRPRLPRAVIALGLVSLFNDVGSEMTFPLLPMLITELGASAAFLGLVLGASDTLASLLKLGSGYWSDRLPARKPLVVFGYGLSAILRPLFAVVTAPWQVLAIRLSDRAGKGVRTAPRDALIADAVVSGGAGRAFGFHQAMDDAGAVVGPLIAAAVLGLGYGHRAAFLVAGVLGFLALPVAVAVREPERAKPRAKAREAASAVPMSGSFKAFLAILGLFAVGNSSDAFLILRANDIGVRPAAIPVLWSAHQLFRMVSAYGGGWLSDKVPRAWIIASGWFIFADVYCAMGFASAPWQAWVLFLVYGLYYGLTDPVQKALVRDVVPAEATGRAFGLYNFVTGIAALPASLIVGELWKRFGPAVALGTGAALAGVSALALLVWNAVRTKPLLRQ